MTTALVNGIPLHFRVHGEGPPLVLVHGLACGLRMWTRQVSMLSRHFTLVLYDQRGHGESGSPDDPTRYSGRHLADDLIGLLDHLNIERAFLVGFSLGGGPSLSLAARQPERVAALVLSDVGSGSEDPWRLQWLARRWGAMAATAPEALYDDMLRHEFFKRYAASRPRARRHMRAIIAATPLVGLRHTLSEVIAKRTTLFRQTRVLRGIDVPTLVIRGRHDYACLRSTKLLAQTIPGALHGAIDKAGHMVPLEQPVAFNAALIDFFGRHGARQAVALGRIHSGPPSPPAR